MSTVLFQTCDSSILKLMLLFLGQGGGGGGGGQRGFPVKF